MLKERNLLFWLSPQLGVLKFNFDGASRGKPRLASIGGVLRNDKGEVLIISKHVGV